LWLPSHGRLYQSRHSSRGHPDRRAVVERLRNLGASVRKTKREATDDHTATRTVMEDPEGIGFCVFEY